METILTEYKVIAVSDNTNSFGLKQFVALAKDGSAFKACANYLNLPQKDKIFNMNVNLETGAIVYTGYDALNKFKPLGWELFEAIDEKAPKDVVKQVW